MSKTVSMALLGLGNKKGIYMTSPYLNLNTDNIADEHICCAIGKGKHQKGEQIKRDWLAQEFEHGLIFRKLNERGKIFIEIMPSEYALKPIVAPNFMVIHCLWVSGKFKGHAHGKTLLNFAIDEAKKQNKDGICVLAGKGNYMTDSKFYKYFGFQKVDQTDNGIFELMSLAFNETATPPQIATPAKKSVLDGGQEITVFTTPQCPFVPTCLNDLKTVAAEMSLNVNVVNVKNHKEICETPSPFGTYGVFLNEKFVTHEMLNEKGYKKIFDKFTA